MHSFLCLFAEGDCWWGCLLPVNLGSVSAVWIKWSYFKLLVLIKMEVNWKNPGRKGTNKAEKTLKGTKIDGLPREWIPAARASHLDSPTDKKKKKPARRVYFFSSQRIWKCWPNRKTHIHFHCGFSRTEWGTNLAFLSPPVKQAPRQGMGSSPLWSWAFTPSR